MVSKEYVKPNTSFSCNFSRPLNSYPKKKGFHEDSCQPIPMFAKKEIREEERRREEVK